MQAGRLRHRIAIQKQVTTQNEYGEATKSFVDAYTSISASIDPINGKEFFSGDKYNSEVSHKVTIRYKSGVLPKMRVEFGSRHFDIKYITNFEERNIFLELACKEVI